MKVLLITPLPPAIGGIARWSEAYLQWSEGKFHTVVINNALLDMGQSRITRCVSQIKRTVGILRSLTGSMKECDIDIAHVNSSCTKLGILRDYICIKKLYKKNIPVVLQCHCNIEDQLGNGYLSRIFFKKAVKYSSKILALNSSSLNFAKACGAKNICVCPNFITREKIAHTPHKINDKIHKAVYVGHLYKDKGVEWILALAKHHPDIEFRLIGPFTKEYNEATVLPENVVFTGAQDGNGVMAELDNADLFLLLSYSEGFSNAMLEAMSRGVPIVATDVGAAADMIEDKGGVVIAAGDAEAASRAVHALSDAEIRAKMSEWNRKKAAGHYESEAVLNRIKAYYLEILDEKK